MQHTQLPNFWLPVATLQTEALVLGNGHDVESKKLSFMHKSRSRPNGKQDYFTRYRKSALEQATRVRAHTGHDKGH